MSSFIKDGYYCIDDYFGSNKYGYIKMTDAEEKAKLGEKWNLLDFKTLEGRGGARRVLKTIPPEFKNIPVAVRNFLTSSYQKR